MQLNRRGKVNDLMVKCEFDSCRHSFLLPEDGDININILLSVTVKYDTYTIQNVNFKVTRISSFL